jgi:hypothetical protein
MLDEDFAIKVSPRHTIRLAREYLPIVERAPSKDFVVRTLVRRQVNGMPLMSAEIVIASAEARAEFPLAKEFPLHFRKTYFPGRLHGDPADEFAAQAEAARLIDVIPPIGFGPTVFRSCMVPGTPYSALSPFQTEPIERNIVHARELPLMVAAGQYRFAEQAFALLERLHAGGVCHGDAELHNFIVCPSPLEIVPIDFEAAALKGKLSDAEWEKRVYTDPEPLLRHGILLQCALGPQPGHFAEVARERLERLFKDASPFQRELARHTA